MYVFTKAQRLKIIAEYQKGCSRRSLAQRYGCDYSTIWWITVKWDLTRSKGA